jgi:bilirubin oxidase
MGPTAITGPFLINNSIFDMNVVNYEIPLNNLEIWTLQNNTPIAHPFHIHNVPFYILDINGQQPPPELSGRKDVVLVPGGQGTVRFITKFEDFANSEVPYMYHCHMLTHEDQGMMGQFIVFDPNADVDENNTESNFEFYPNPISNQLFVNSKIETVITICNTAGSEVYKAMNSLGSIIFDVTSLHQGTYILNAKNKEFDKSFVLIKK